MTRKTNPFAKTRKQEDPYAVYRNNSGWEWRILKTYKLAENEPADPYARWFVAATSPFMHNGEFEMGDTYRADIVGSAYLAWATDEWKAAHDVNIRADQQGATS